MIVTNESIDKGVCTLNLTILEKLRELNTPHDWDYLVPSMHPKISRWFGNEPVYEFYYTLTHSLEISPQSIAISVQPINSYIPYHIHNYVELISPLIGDCVVWIKDKKILLKQNDLLIVGKNTVHRVERIASEQIVINLALKNSAFSLNDFNFIRHGKQTPSTANELFSLLSNEELGDDSYSLFHASEDLRVATTIDSILEEYYQPDIQSKQIIHFQILTLFSRLLRVASQSFSNVETKKKDSSNTLSLLLYIEKNYATITLEQMADDFGFNPNYLSTHLKQKTGYSFIKLVQLQRLNIAADYLSFTNASIEQISHKVGYENPSYSYKIFRKQFGLSPREYRDQQQDTH